MIFSFRLNGYLPRLTEMIHDEVANDDIDSFNDTLTATLIDIATSSIPKTSGRLHNRRHNPWWNDECNEAKRTKRKWEKKWRQDNNEYKQQYITIKI